MDQFAEGDPAGTPKGGTFLQASVTYREIDTRHLEMIEEQLLGRERVNAWTVDDEQREADALHPYTQLW